MPALKEYNEFGQLICTIDGLLAPVTLASVATTSGQSSITCTSTTGVYPGMVLRCAGFAGPVIVHAVRNSTTLDLVASTFSAAGVWTTSAANAQATASLSSLTATVLAFDPQAIVSAAYAMGTWRNIHRLTNSNFYYHTAPTSYAVASTYGAGVALVPTTTTTPAAAGAMSGQFLATAARIASTDELDATPLKRHNGEFWGFHFVVSTGGHLSKLPAIPTNRIVYAP